jgi:DNA sulfur modification protein DndD
VIREQDGRTLLDIERMVNLDAVQGGETPFGVSLRFSHNDAEYLLHRSATATEERTGKIVVTHPSIDLIPTGGLPYPAANIPEIIDGILSHDISDFFFFDGEMLNRFEERLRDERTTTQGFVRSQVERALGLPFMKSLESDLDAIQSTITANMNLVLKKEKKHNDLTEKFNAKSDEIASTEDDLAKLRVRDEELVKEIGELDAQLSKVDEIKDLFYERKSLESEVEKAADTIKDYGDAIADLAESNWWLPAADLLLKDFETAEADIETAENIDRERFKITYKLDQLEKQLGTGLCPACGQPVANHDEPQLRTEIAELQEALAQTPSTGIEDARRRRDQLRRFNNGRSALQRVFEQEQDLGRERLRNDKRLQRIRQISEQISGNTVDIESLERNLIDRFDWPAGNEASGTKTRDQLTGRSDCRSAGG